MTATNAPGRQLLRAHTASPRVSPTVYGYGALAFLSFVPVLLTAPGRVAADTKQYLYLDPARLLSRAPSMWDPSIGMGTVTHQNIGYLFPMGPFYWIFDRLGVPDWVAQRIWLGSLLFFAAAGVLYLFRSFGIRGPGVVVGALAYMLSPYSLEYAARLSVLLLPWAALPWMVGLVKKALRDGGWRYPAVFALVVQVVGGVNATALIFAGVAPVLWIVFAWIVARDASLRRALNVTCKILALTVLTSAWWIAGLTLQGGYGINVLKYTETVRAVARTSMPNEVLRGLGYWFFYGGDRLGPWIEGAENYTQRPAIILVGYGLVCLALLAAATLRWRHRAYFVALTLVGVVIAVGPHPYDSPTPLGAVFRKIATGSTAGLAMRSTGRAVPLVVLGLAVLLGAGVNSFTATLRRIGRPRLASATPAFVALLVVANLPALYDDTWYGKNLQRPEDVPAYWDEAARYLDTRGNDTRVFEIPGEDFASYRWGNTVDPITPGLIDRPYVARELIPYGTPGTADLLNALDRRMQEGLFDDRGFAALVRRMGVGDVVLRNDIQYERYNVIPAREIQRAMNDVPGLAEPVAFGERTPIVYDRPNESEVSIASPANEPAPNPVVVYPIEDPTPIVRAESARRMLVVAGDGEGLVDVADIGLLDSAGAVVYSASYADAQALRSALGDEAILVLTDSNRSRARKWSMLRDNLGYTEQSGEQPLREDPGDARLDVFPDAPAASFALVEQRGVRSVQATGYGNPITYTPEDRATRAFDGDVDSAWRVAAFDEAIGHRLRVELDETITTDRVNLVQPLNGALDRYMTEVTLRFDGDSPKRVMLSAMSRTEFGQTVSFGRRTFRTLDIEVQNVNVGRRLLHGGASAVGFAEIRLRDEKADGDVRVDEVVLMPSDLLDAVGTRSLDNPLVIVMNRQRVVPVPPRTDEELGLVREFELPTARTFTLTGDARFTSDVEHAVLDSALGLPAPDEQGIATDASEFLAGCISCRANAAIDADPSTIWNTPFVGVRRQWVEYELPEPLAFSHMDLQVVADGRHSVPTRIRVQADDATREITLPPIADEPAENATHTFRLDFPVMTGRRIRVTLVDVRETEVFNFGASEPVLAPAGITELGIAGLDLPHAPRALPGECRSDLLSIDGEPFPVRIAGARADAERLGRLDIEPCDPEDPAATPALSLSAGRHELRARSGLDTAVQLDRLVLASDAGGAALGASGGRVTGLPNTMPPAPKVEVVDDGRTKMRLRVTGATEPFWLVLGQSRSDGWRATADGLGDLGTSSLVDGYANGWFVTPDGRESFDVTLEWTPQQRVWVALAVTVLAVLACLVLIVFGTRRRREIGVGGDDAGMVENRDARVGAAWPWHHAGAPASRSLSIAGSVGAAVFGAVVVAPWVGALVGVLVLVALRRPPARALLGLTPVVLLGLVALYIASKQERAGLPPVFEWPTLFPRARTAAWLAAVLISADAYVEVLHARGAGRDLGEGAPDEV